MRRVIALALALGTLVVGCHGDEYCADTCPVAGDGECDDGREGAVTALCARGTDCTDCGAWAPAREAAGYTIDRPGPPVTSRGSAAPCQPAPDVTCAEWQCDSGGRTLYHVGGGSTGGCVGVGCTATWWSCPTDPNDASVYWECRDGDQGVGCYFAGSESLSSGTHVEFCQPAGECDNGTVIERCVRMIAFSRPSTMDPGFFNANICSTWFQIDDWRKDCGSCNDPCNLSIDEAAQGCLAEEEPVDPPPTGVSPSCRVNIDEYIDTLRSITSGNSCLTRCTNNFASCAERDNCSNISACSNTAQSCVIGCS